MWLPLIFFLWVVVVAIVEVASTTVVQRHGAVVMLTTKHWIGTASAVAAGSMMQTKIPAFYWCRQLSASWRSLEGKLFLGVAFGNIAALYCMYTAYGSGGMAGAYAFKSTEPLMTCILSTVLFQRLIGLLIPSDHLSKRAPPGPMEWFSVGLVCLGSTMCSLALHGMSLATVSVTSSWILASNFAFGARTVFQKALFLESPVVTAGQTDVVVRLFVDMGAVGSVFFTLSFLWEFPTLDFTTPDSPLRGDDIICMVISGVGYFVVQALNCLVLLHFTSVEYSVAKQMRVIILFVFSAMYFAVTFQHPWLAVFGGALVIGGTLLFSTKRESQSTNAVSFDGAS
jgi:drug/metabolite transporter (DMT)-like permease